MNLTINSKLEIPANEIHWRFSRSSGSGGQKVNKTESAVQLRFNVRTIGSLPEEVFLRLKTLSGGRMTGHGVIVISASRFRSQEKNRRDALDRLVSLISKAAIAPKNRRPTKPSKTAKQRRLENKRHRSNAKKARSKIGPD